MFTIQKGQAAGEHALVAPDGDTLPVRPDVWERLREPNEIFVEWKKFLQKWSIHVDKAPLLKRECPTDNDYRNLRTAIRTFLEPK